MSVALQLELSEELAALLLCEASRRGLTVGEYIESLIYQQSSQDESIPMEGMVSSLAKMDREVTTIRRDVDELKRQQSSRSVRIEELAGCFTGDEQWAAIHEEIEQKRRQPDPELSDTSPCGSGTQT
jgi:hypothetical protein